jgi:hypothetical protein
MNVDTFEYFCTYYTSFLFVSTYSYLLYFFCTYRTIIIYLYSHYIPTVSLSLHLTTMCCVVFTYDSVITFNSSRREREKERNWTDTETKLLMACKTRSREKTYAPLAQVGAINHKR